MNAAKLRVLLAEESVGIHPRLILLRLRTALQSPARTAQYLPELLRRAGFAIGPRSTVLGLPRITGSLRNAHDDVPAASLYEHLHIGSDVVLDAEIVLDLEERITIGDRVLIGRQAMILTSTHELGPREHRAGPVVRNPVVIEDGAWIGARSVILPGVTIGAGAVVNPGSVVNKDVPPHTRVAGTPAKKVESFEPAE